MAVGVADEEVLEERVAVLEVKVVTTIKSPMESQHNHHRI